MDASDVELFTAMQALYSALGAALSTKDTDNIRAEVDDHFAELYETTGAKSFDLKVGGEKRGTYSIKFTKAKSEKRLEVDNRAEYLEWARANGFVRETVDDAAVRAHFESTGDIPAGCIVQSLDIPAQYAGGTIRLSDETKQLAWDALMNGGAARLLEGGD